MNSSSSKTKPETKKSGLVINKNLIISKKTTALPVKKSGLFLGKP
jgi:hypothetical protein